MLAICLFVGFAADIDAAEPVQESITDRTLDWPDWSQVGASIQFSGLQHSCGYCRHDAAGEWPPEQLAVSRYCGAEH
jgi:hypothetical protein